MRIMGGFKGRRNYFTQGLRNVLAPQKRIRMPPISGSCYTLTRPLGPLSGYTKRPRPGVLLQCTASVTSIN